MTATLTRIVGFAGDEQISEQLHRLRHRSAVETIVLSREDTLRRRLRVVSEAGNEYLIAISRAQRLCDGAVLALESDSAILVRMTEENWLRLLPETAADALELGYFAGNLHWRVRFNGPELNIALEGPESGYLDRLKPFLESGRVERITDG